MKEKFGLNQMVKEARKRLNLTQQQLAEKLGLGKRGKITVSEWETGKRNISIYYKEKIEKMVKKQPISNNLSGDFFNEFGKPVSDHRANKCYKEVKNIWQDCPNEIAYAIVGKIKQAVERDEPFLILGAVESLDNDLCNIDLTGRYRLLAAILCD